MAATGHSQAEAEIGKWARERKTQLGGSGFRGSALSSPASITLKRQSSHGCLLLSWQQKPCFFEVKPSEGLQLGVPESTRLLYAQVGMGVGSEGLGPQ